MDETELNLRDHWLAIRKHLRLIAAVFFASLLMTLLLVFITTPTYTGVSTLLIERNAPQVLDIRQVLSEPLLPDEYDFYKTQYELLRSRSLAAQVIREQSLADNRLFDDSDENRGLIGGIWSRIASWLGAWFESSANDEIYAEERALGVKPKIIDEYLKRLEISPARGTRLVRIGFSTPDPKLCARLADAHAQAYIHQGLQLHSNANQEAQRFLEGKLTELKERVEKSEAALNAYRRDKGIISLSDNNKVDKADKEDIVVTRLDELNQELTKAEEERIALEGEEQQIRNRDYDSLPAVIKSPLIQQLKQDFSRLEGDYAKLAAEFKSGYPELDQIHAQVEETGGRLTSEIQKVVSGIESAYLAAVNKEKELRAKMEEQKTLALSQKNAGVQYAILAREVDTNRQLYDSILQRMKETGVAADVHASNAFIVDRAEVPRKPSKPQKAIDLLSGALLGLFGGVALALFLESLDKRLKNPEDVECFLHLPSLAVVPDFLSLNGKANSYPYAYQPLAAPRVRELRNGKSQSTELVVTNNRFSAIAESYRTLRAAILLSRAGDPPRVTLVTSAINSEGKTVTAVNTAIVFSQLNARVLLIDADLRRPRCHRILQMANGVGLSEVLTGQVEVEAAIQPTNIAQVFLLSSGASPPNPAELIGSDMMEATLARLRSQYDYIVIDSTPTMLVSDALPLAAIVDGTLLVVNSAETPRHVAREACARLQYVGAKILGVVLNKADVNSPDYYYSHHYYTYNRNSYYHQNPEEQA